jgi:hypothetical protein
VFLCVVLLAACTSSAPPLRNAHPSPEALSVAFLDALARRDADALRGLALNEEEFREHVWPELPAARPERNLPFSYVWGDLRQKSEQSLVQTLAAHGGRRYTLIETQFSGDTTRYPSYTVHRETTLRVRDDAGVQHDLRLFGSSVEKDRTWKIFSFVVDD